MKFLLIAIVGLLTSNPVLDVDTKAINVTDSKVVWTGKKVTGSHTGTIALKEGNIEMNGSAISGGSFTIDMTSLACTDLEGTMNGKLVGHLSSPDFFAIADFPTATLVITDAKAAQDGVQSITGDLTIKGITMPVTFDASLSADKATANIVVDRTKYGIKYGSGSFFDNLGDKAISDNFDLEVSLAF